MKRHAWALRVVPLVLSILFAGCSERVQGPQRYAPEVPSQQPAPLPPSPPPPVPPPTFEVRVRAVTSGVELDPDGYRAEIVYNPDEMLPYYASDTVGTNSSTIFQLGTGAYYASLSGIAPNCTPVPPGSAPVLLGSNFATTLVTLEVECLSIPATQGVRVTTVTTGTYPDTASFGLQLITNGDDTVRPFTSIRLIGANETVRMPSPVGSFSVGFSALALWRRCAVKPTSFQTVLVEPNSIVSLTFNVACGA
jgi:hypothetical protein